MILDARLKSPIGDPNHFAQTKVQWGSNQAYPQFRMWRKEVERILNGPMFNDPHSVKLNTVYIWAGAHAETLIEARQSRSQYFSTFNISETTRDRAIVTIERQ